MLRTLFLVLVMTQVASAQYYGSRTIDVYHHYPYYPGPPAAYSYSPAPVVIGPIYTAPNPVLVEQAREIRQRREASEEAFDRFHKEYMAGQERWHKIQEKNDQKEREEAKRRAIEYRKERQRISERLAAQRKEREANRPQK